MFDVYRLTVTTFEVKKFQKIWLQNLMTTFNDFWHIFFVWFLVQFWMISNLVKRNAKICNRKRRKKTCVPHDYRDDKSC